MKIEYRITGRFRKDDKRHVVDYNRKWTLTDAQNRLKQLQSQSEWYKNFKPTATCGSVGITTDFSMYYSDYDLLELRIESREITPWESID